MSYKFCPNCEKETWFQDDRYNFPYEESNNLMVSQYCSECGSKYEFTSKKMMMDLIDNLTDLLGRSDDQSIDQVIADLKNDGYDNATINKIKKRIIDFAKSGNKLK